MSLGRLRWITVLAPLAFLVAVDFVRHVVEPQLLHAWPGHILVGGAILIAALVFSERVFAVVYQFQERQKQHNRELLALHEAGLGIAGELGLEAVLQKVVDAARELVGARYGALSVPSPEGGIEAFITSGITAEERARLGSPPVGHGLLGVVLTEGQRLRIPEIGRDRRRHGFPQHHPDMHSLLAVPVVSAGRILGNLYVTEKQGAPQFALDDEETLVRFATQAALAIENARLHRRVRELAVTEERERIAREMHDGLAQVLGYVNTKAQAIQELLRSGQSERAEAQTRQLGEAARDAYADVREGILSLRTSLGPGRGLVDALGAYLQAWQEQSSISAELIVQPSGSTLVSLGPAAELQLLRIIQEALANVRKHAVASRARITLTESASGVEALVEDDGRGFDPTNLGGAGFPRFGLSTMRERAEAVGGSLAVDAAPGRGTRIVANIPASVGPSAEGAAHARAHR